MKSKELKKVLGIFKGVAGFPLGNPGVLLDDGVLSASWRGYTVKYPGDLEGPKGVYTIKSILPLLKGDDAVTLEDDGQKQHCVVGDHRYQIGFGGLAADMPDPLEIESEVQVHGQVVLPWKHVAFAADHDEGRPHLNAVKLEANPMGLRMIATDGHRLAMRNIEGSFDEGDLLVPLSIVKLLSKLPELQSFAWGSDGAAFLAGRWQVFFRAADARFPPWHKVVPHGDFKWSIGALRADWIRAINLAVILKGRALMIDVKEDAHLSQTDLDGNASDISMQAEVIGAPQLFGVNAKYFREAIEHTQANPVIVQGHGPTDVMMVNDDQVVMPMRL